MTFLSTSLQTRGESQVATEVLRKLPRVIEKSGGNPTYPWEHAVLCLLLGATIRYPLARRWSGTALGRYNFLRGSLTSLQECHVTLK